MGGPIWNQKIHDVAFVKRLMESCREADADQTPGKQKFQTSPRIQAILSAIIDEDCVAHQPLSYDLS
jgi:tRNA G26 N,N-dimethylase Trm1